MISANEINALLENYLKSNDGKDFLNKQGISISFYDEEQLRQIAEHLKNDIINEFLRITNHASLIDAQDYFGGAHVKVGKVSHTKNGDKVNINFSDHSLYRPSLVGRNGKPTGEGINDIFALIIILKEVLSYTDFKMMMNEIEYEIDWLSSKLKCSAICLLLDNVSIL